LLPCFLVDPRRIKYLCSSIFMVNQSFMKSSAKLFLALSLFYSLGIPGSLKAQPDKSEKEIPLIKRELLFDNPEISSGQLSPDGSMVSFLKAYDGIMNLWVKAFD